MNLPFFIQNHMHLSLNSFKTYLVYNFLSEILKIIPNYIKVIKVCQKLLREFNSLEENTLFTKGVE